MGASVGDGGDGRFFAAAFLSALLALLTFAGPLRAEDDDGRGEGEIVLFVGNVCGPAKDARAEGLVAVCVSVDAGGRTNSLGEDCDGAGGCGCDTGDDDAKHKEVRSSQQSLDLEHTRSQKHTPVHVPHLPAQEKGLDGEPGELKRSVETFFSDWLWVSSGPSCLDVGLDGKIFWVP